VIVNGFTAEQALEACQMTGSVPLSALYSQTKATRERGGTYDDQVQRADARRIGTNIDISEDKETTRVVLPVTIDTYLAIPNQLSKLSTDITILKEDPMLSKKNAKK
jgi:hypothetical protein